MGLTFSCRAGCQAAALPARVGSAERARRGVCRRGRRRSAAVPAAEGPGWTPSAPGADRTRPPADAVELAGRSGAAARRGSSGVSRAGGSPALPPGCRGAPPPPAATASASFTGARVLPAAALGPAIWSAAAGAGAAARAAGSAARWAGAAAESGTLAAQADADGRDAAAAA